MESKKSNKIREIVRLQQILKKWRKIANASKTITTTTATTNNIVSSSNKSIKFLKRTLSISDNLNNSVPKGFLAVSIGQEQKRYIIPTDYLSHQAFHILLQEAEEEFGFQQAGVLRIPCDVSVFENILKIMEDNDKDAAVLMNECRFRVDDSLSYCSSDSQRTPSHHPQSPMCR